jgi:hypothetical protein
LKTNIFSCFEKNALAYYDAGVLVANSEIVDWLLVGYEETYWHKTSILKFHNTIILLLLNIFSKFAVYKAGICIYVRNGKR